MSDKKEQKCGQDGSRREGIMLLSAVLIMIAAIVIVSQLDGPSLSRDGDSSPTVCLGTGYVFFCL